MICNYNDLIRKQISDLLKDNSDDTLINAIEFFEQLENDEQENILRLALCDLYKINYYYGGTITELFKFSIDQIIDACIVDAVFVIKVMQASKVFYEMDYVSKFLLLEHMKENNQDSILFSINKFHAIDKITYQIVDDIEYYKKYYKEYLEVNKDKTNRVQAITDFLCYRMLEIKYDDANKYKRYVLKFIKCYYKWKNFIKNHEGDYLLNKDDITYLEKIESYSIDDLFNELENDFDFLVTVIGEYFYYTTQKIEVKKEFVDSYYETNSSEKLKEKLNVKK